MLDESDALNKIRHHPSEGRLRYFNSSVSISPQCLSSNHIWNPFAQKAPIYWGRHTLYPLGLSVKRTGRCLKKIVRPAYQKEYLVCLKSFLARVDGFCLDLVLILNFEVTIESCKESIDRLIPWALCPDHSLATFYVNITQYWNQELIFIYWIMCV